jgi:hypothetical protein
MARQCLALLAAFASVAKFAICAELGRARESALEAEWGSELQAPAQPRVVEYNSPIKRVVALLRKMAEELQYETEHEAEMYDKMVCWCETNEKEKSKAIADADNKDKLLTAEIESRSSRFGELTTEIEALKKEISKLHDTLNKATSLRDKAASAFVKEQTSLTRALANIKDAIVILSKHHSFLEIGSTVMLGMKTVLRDVAMQHELLSDHDASQRHSVAVKNSLIELESTSERASSQESQRMSRELLKALDAKAAGLDGGLPVKFAEQLVSRSAKSAAPASATVFLQGQKPPSYTSQSGPVFGMLKQMKEDFAEALAKAQEDEKRAKKDFEELSKAKSAQIDASMNKLDDLLVEGTKNTYALNEAKEDLHATRQQRAADVQFLSNLKQTCQDLDQQFEKRSKTRSQELQAVSEALAIITKDDNADLLRNSVQFLQLGSKTKDSRRSDAANVLEDGLNSMFNADDDLLNAWEDRHGTVTNLGKSHQHVQSQVAVRSAGDDLQRSRTRLAALAITVKLDSFDKVKEAMDKLATQLKREQEEEVRFKARCVKDFDKNEKAEFKKTDQKEDLEAGIKELTALTGKLKKEIDEAQEHISETEIEKKKASQNREAENTQFQSVVADQRATQDILKKALAKLKSFYAKGQQAGFLQSDAEQTPPAHFTAYKTNAGASPVINMIQTIIEDSAQLEHECVAGERHAQQDYERFIKDGNDLIKTLRDEAVSKGEAVAAADSKLATAKGDLETTNGILADLAKVKEDLHAECDFVFKNFEIRQKARATELEAIMAAKSILSGAKSS